MNDQRIDVRNVDSCLDDRRTDKNIRVSFEERDQLTLEFGFRHPTVRRDNPCFRYERANLFCLSLDAFDPVIQEERLSPPTEFPLECFPHDDSVVFHDIRLDRITVFRWGLKDREIADPDHRHVQCSRNRCRCQRQDINVRLQLFQTLFVFHTESLLFINDQ